VKEFIFDENNINFLDTIIQSIGGQGSVCFKASLLACLIELCSNNICITKYVRNNLDISNLVSIIKYQYTEINCKVAYLATLLTNDKNISLDFQNLIKQIIFQIARMLQATESGALVDGMKTEEGHQNNVLEGTTMLYNLVKVNEDEDTQTMNDEEDSPSKILLTRTIYSHICDVGALELLSKQLKKYSDEYIEEIKNKEKAEEEAKTGEYMDVDMSEKIIYPDGFKDHFDIIMQSLNIVKFLMEAKESCVNKIITAGIPAIIFNLLDKNLGDDIRL